MIRMTTVQTAMIAALFASVTAVHGLRAAERPNIVVILADDLGYGDVGCYGATKVKTPNLDRLAEQGIRFTDAHSASAVCTPSRYALLTGEYPFRINCWGPLGTHGGLLIDPSRTTLASLLKRQGYATACIGKWHLGFGNPKPDWNGELKPGPLEVGFDHYFGVPIVSSIPPYVYVQDHRVVGLDPADPLVFGKEAAGKIHTTLYPEKGVAGVGGAKAAHALYREEEFATTLTAKAQGWIRDHASRPFFLCFTTPHIHHPFSADPTFKSSSSAGRYGDFVQEFDGMVGEILRTLDELKLAQNTLVIVTSDNGGMLNQGGQDAWKAGHRMNGALLGFKFDAWEGGHRVPFIARWPGHIASRAVSEQLICHVDLPATLAALTGYALKPGEAPDSVNVLDALIGQPQHPLRDHVVLAPFRNSHLAIRQGNWVYIGAQGGGGFTGTKPGAHTLGGPAALTFTGETNSDVVAGRIRPDAPPAQLYDLHADPSQTTNVILQHPEVAERLKKLLRNATGDLP